MRTDLWKPYNLVGEFYTVKSILPSTNEASELSAISYEFGNNSTSPENASKCSIFALVCKILSAASWSWLQNALLHLKNEFIPGLIIVFQNSVNAAPPPPPICHEPCAFYLFISH